MAGVENGFRAARNFFHSFLFSILISLTSLLQYLFPCMNIEYIFLTSTPPPPPPPTPTISFLMVCPLYSSKLKRDSSNKIA